MAESVFKRAESPDDPNRCQAVGGHGQCPFVATGSRKDGASPWEGSMYCPRHGGNKQAESQRKESTRLYMAALWKDRIGYQADHPKYKSLREEMGILRVTLDTKLGSFHSDQELILHAGQVTELAREIGKLAKVAHAIEKDMGQLLDKTQAEAWVQELIGIIGNYITDPEMLQFVAEDMLSSLERRTTI